MAAKDFGAPHQDTADMGGAPAYACECIIRVGEIKLRWTFVNAAYVFTHGLETEIFHLAVTCRRNLTGRAPGARTVIPSRRHRLH